jgi:hypothetical protein
MLTACLAVTATALGGPRDRDRDRLPDGWEKRHHISTHSRSAKKDPDRDGLSNLGEFRASTDPRDRDSDDDGLRDGAEHIGTVRSFEDGVLTIALAGGGTVSGAITDATELKCENHAVVARASHDDDEDRDNSGPGSANSGPGKADDDDAPAGPTGPTGPSDDGADDHGGDRDRTCPDGALAPGARVEEAELKLTAGGPWFDEIELRN